LVWVYFSVVGVEEQIVKKQSVVVHIFEGFFVYVLLNIERDLAMVF